MIDIASELIRTAAAMMRVWAKVTIESKRHDCGTNSDYHRSADSIIRNQGLHSDDVDGGIEVMRGRDRERQNA